MSKYWICALLTAAVFLTVACNDDPGPGMQTDTGAADAGDVTTDRLADAPPDDGADAVDTGDGTADTADAPACGDLTPCDPGDSCDGDFTCHQGCCVPTTECAAQDQPCTGASFDTDGFVCDLPVGICGRRCDTATPWNCPLGSWCVTTDRPAQARDGLCRNSECDDICFDPASCADSAFTCDAGDGAGSGTCVAFGQDANLCLDAGETVEGGDCAGEADAIDNGLPCAAGLRCFEGKCVVPCLYDDTNPAGGCAGDPECLPAFVFAGDNKPGICGEPCDPFSTGQCDAGWGCTFAVAEGTIEVTTWYCSDLPGDGLPTVEIEEECSTADPPTNLCEEGHYCHVETTTGMCVQYCDLDDGSGDLADCPVLGGDPVLGDGVGSSAFGDVTTYETVAAATSELDVWDLSGAGEVIFAALDSVDLEAGKAYSIVAWDDGTDTAAVITDWTDGAAAMSPGAPYFSLYNLSTTAIHMYSVIDDFFATTLAAGANSDALTVENGAATALGFGFYVEAEYGADGLWADFESINQAHVNWGGYIDVLAIGSIEASGEEPQARLAIFNYELPDLGTDEAGLLFINASASTPSVDVDWGPGSMTDETDIGFGNATSVWSKVAVPEGSTLNVGVDLTWAADGGGTDSYSVIAVDRGHLVTVIFWDNPSGTDREIVSSNHTSDLVAGEATFQLTNLTEHPLGLGRMEAALARGVAAPRYPATGAAFAGAGGTETLVIRDVAGVGDEPLLEEPGVVFNADMVRGIVFRPTGTTPAWDIFDFEHAAPTLPDAISGDAAVRFVHGAEGTGDLLVRLRRVFGCVATDITGVGRRVE